MRTVTYIVLTVACLLMLAARCHAQEPDQPVSTNALRLPLGSYPTADPMALWLTVGPRHQVYAPNRTADIAVAVAELADSLSTLQALLEFGPAFREQNPLMSNWAFPATKVAGTLLGGVLAHRLRRQGHNVAANVAQYGVTAVLGSFTILNERRMAAAR